MDLIPPGSRFQILVGDGCPAFYQKAMRVIITSGHTTQRPFGNQASGSDTGGTDDTLGSIAPKSIRVFIDVHCHAIHMNGLVNISGNASSASAAAHARHARDFHREAGVGRL